MKISRKMLAALSLAAAFIGGGVFTSCSEEDDDPAGAITGSNKDYSINYTNTTSDVYRCTNTTTFRHLGEVVKIQINNQTKDSDDGVMGFIWDLKQSKDAAKWVEGTQTTAPAVTDKGFQNFFVMGFRNEKGAIKYYISRYFNVTDIQADNFGAESANAVATYKDGILKNVPCEIEVQTWTALGDNIKIADDKTVTVWADIYPVYENSEYGVDRASHNTDSTKYGAYVVDLYDADPSVENNHQLVGTVVIPSATTGYTAKPDSGTLAVYANVYRDGKVLSGSWNLSKDYGADEVVEE